MEREYARMESVVAAARKGQDFIQRQCALLGEISEQRQAFYAKYQSQIELAQTRMSELKEQAREMRATA